MSRIITFNQGILHAFAVNKVGTHIFYIYKISVINYTEIRKRGWKKRKELEHNPQ